jgi:hypothetical protein
LLNNINVKAYTNKIELVQKVGLIEVRILNTNRGTISGYYDDYKKLQQDILQYNGKYNIYCTLNPVRKELLARSNNHLTEFVKTTTTDADIEKRSMLLIDIDPIRPAGISSSEEEHQKAIIKADMIKSFLTERGFPEPILADSGNGAHLIYNVDLSNDNESTEMVQKFLLSLDRMFSDNFVEVDKTTYNAARICKIYGTIACKGDHTDDRPHRVARIIIEPSIREVVTKEQLQLIVSLLPLEVKQNNDFEKTEKFELKAWMKKHELEIYQEKRWGNANLYILKQCPWREEHKNYSSFIIQYDEGGIAAGCHHNSCSEENWYTLREKLEPGYREKKKSSKKNDNEAKESQADILIKEGDEAELFSDDIDEKYAVVNVNQHKEVYKINSKKFQLWLTKKYFDKTGKAPGSDAMNQALGVYMMNAMFNGNKKNLFKRCGKHEGKIYYDLADENWRTVEISKEGWKVINDAPVLFIKNKNMKSQVIPVDYNDLGILDKHYRFKNEEDRILHKVGIVSKFIPDIGHPIVVLYGEKGSSKTTSMKKDRSIVDPAYSDVVSLPKCKEDLAIALNKSRNPCFDNLVNISSEMSDMLCMAATGGAFTKRTLYTDDEETILYFKVPVSLNGINVVATRPDLLDRSILLELERIPADERKEESVVWDEFYKDLPKILGAIYSTLSKAMNIYDDVKIERLGRMADFTRWGYAIAEVLGIGGEAFLDAYINNQERANEEALETNPIALAMIKFMSNKPTWTGTVTQLLWELNRTATKEDINTYSKLWAKEANVLSRRLKEIKSNLELVGINYVIAHQSEGKVITVTKTQENTITPKLNIENNQVDDDSYGEINF